MEKFFVNDSDTANCIWFADHPKITHYIYISFRYDAIT